MYACAQDCLTFRPVKSGLVKSTGETNLGRYRLGTGWITVVNNVRGGCIPILACWKWRVVVGLWM